LQNDEALNFIVHFFLAHSVAASCQLLLNEYGMVWYVYVRYANHESGATCIL